MRCDSTQKNHEKILNNKKVRTRIKKIEIGQNKMLWYFKHFATHLRSDNDTIIHTHKHFFLWSGGNVEVNETEISHR